MHDRKLNRDELERNIAELMRNIVEKAKNQAIKDSETLPEEWLGAIAGDPQKAGEILREVLWKLKGALMKSGYDLKAASLFVEKEYYLEVLREFFARTEGNACCMDKARFVFKLYVSHILEGKPFEYNPSSHFYVPSVEAEKMLAVMEQLTKRDKRLLAEKLTELLEDDKVAGLVRKSGDEVKPGDGKLKSVDIIDIKEAHSRRVKLKAVLVYITSYMLNKMHDTPTKATVLLVLYLLHSQYGFRYTKFRSSFYGPYSRGADIVFSELSGEAFATEWGWKNDNDNAGSMIVVKRMLPRAEKYLSWLDDDEKRRLDEALLDIYTRFADDTSRLSLENILDEIYERDEAYSRTGFGEKIEFCEGDFHEDKGHQNHSQQG